MNNHEKAYFIMCSAVSDVIDDLDAVINYSDCPYEFRQILQQQVELLKSAQQNAEETIVSG